MLTSLAQQALPRTFHRPRVSLRAPLAPCCTDVPCASLFRPRLRRQPDLQGRLSVHTGGPEVCPLPCSQERPCLLGGTGPLRRPGDCHLPSCQGAFPSAPRLGPSPQAVQGSRGFRVPVQSSRRLLHTRAHSRRHMRAHTDAHTCINSIRGPLPPFHPSNKSLPSPTYHKPVSRLDDADERYLHPVIKGLRVRFINYLFSAC